MESSFIRLQQDVVAELALTSTNPSVPPIAAQALAGFHAFERDDRHIPEDLMQMLRSHFDGYFRDLGFRYELISPYSPTLERYARAMTSLPTCSYEQWSWIWNRIMAVRIQDLDIAFLIISSAQMESSDYHVSSCWASLLDYFLYQDPIATSSVHLWQYKQLMESITDKVAEDLFSEALGFSVSDLLKKFLKLVSPNKTEWFQVQVLLHIFKCHFLVNFSGPVSLVS